MGVEIVHATYILMCKYIDELKEIDKFYFKSEAWNKENFLSEANLKFDLSRFIIFEEKLIGYVIASSKDANIHIHRFVIKNEFKNQNLGSKLMSVLLNEKKIITLKVAIDNLIAVNFYKKLNFVIMLSENQYYLMKNENI